MSTIVVHRGRNTEIFSKIEAYYVQNPSGAGKNYKFSCGEALKNLKIEKGDANEGSLLEIFEILKILEKP